MVPIDLIDTLNPNPKLKIILLLRTRLKTRNHFLKKLLKNASLKKFLRRRRVPYGGYGR